MFSPKIQSMLGSGVVVVMATVGLSACHVSNDPFINRVATTAAVGGVAALLFYSINDGYYYDRNYNRLPRDYRPSGNERVQRVDNIDNYRRQHYQRQQSRERYDERYPDYRPSRGRY